MRSSKARAPSGLYLSRPPSPATRTAGNRS
jgi:hypothetical protein